MGHDFGSHAHCYTFRPEHKQHGQFRRQRNRFLHAPVIGVNKLCQVFIKKSLAGKG